MSEAADRFLAKKFGVFSHYLNGIQNGGDSRRNPSGKRTTWNGLVNELDTDKLAYSLNKMGAGYFFITLMQGTAQLCAPNSAFDRICGTKPGEACSTRDLPADLYDSLSKYGIDLFLYYTGDGPHLTPVINELMGMPEPRIPVTEKFLNNWSEVLREYSERYGNKVKGWWIDGCYDWLGYNEKTLAYYDRAIKSGNPDALIAYNYAGAAEGPLIRSPYPEEYVAGERNDFICIPQGRYIDGAQAHVFAPLGVLPEGYGGGAWAFPGTKRDREYMLDYIKKVDAAGATVTVDIVLYRDGGFAPEQEELLTYVGTHLQK